MTGIRAGDTRTIMLAAATAIAIVAAANAAATVIEQSRQRAAIRAELFARAEAIRVAARRYIGVPYRFGGATPDGWDCTRATRAALGNVSRETAD